MFGPVVTWIAAFLVPALGAGPVLVTVTFVALARPVAALLATWIGTWTCEVLVNTRGPVTVKPALLNVTVAPWAKLVPVSVSVVSAPCPIDVGVTVVTVGAPTPVT